jgi:hypothetical protein
MNGNQFKKNNNNVLIEGSNSLNKENWMVHHPNGRHMFTCGEKKAMWYLEKDLAKVIGNKKIKFTFDPRGNGFEDNEEFGRNARENRCVVSGVVDGLQRHHIVPYCYRSFFPEEYKSKNHHDVVLINYKPHADYEVKATQFKDEIARIYGVKTIAELNAEYTTKLREFSRDDVILISNIGSLFKSYHWISYELKLEKLKLISELSGIPFETLCSYNYLQLYKIYKYLSDEHFNNVDKFKAENRMYYDHGYHVIQKLDSEDKIENFVKLWRNHFIDTMNPQHMPIGWSVDFRIKTKI